MAGYRRYELVEQSSSPFYIKETSIFAPKASPFPFPPFMDEEELSFALDVLSPSPLFPSFPKVKVLDFPEKSSPFDSICEDLVQIETTPFQTTYKRVVQRRRPAPKELYLQKIADRVSALESKFDRMLKVRERELVDRKYTWTAEIGGPVERKYKLTAEIKGSAEEEKAKEKKNNKKVGERSYKWMTEIKGKDDEKRTYTWKATIGGDKGEKCEADEGKKKGEKTKKKKEKRTCEARIVEIEDPSDHRTVILRQAFARRVGGASRKGKTKELSPQDAAMMIQFTFREYLIRRSRALRALRELAVAKTKLKELRTLFHNFSYRNRVARDAEERQKFSERIIVLLLTVDAIEGVDIMVRAAKRSMVDELEAMLDVVDPQPGGKSFLMTRRRTFDMPSGDIQKEIEEGVAQVVQMIEEENASD